MSAMASWLELASLRTLRPNIIIGTSTSGTQATTTKVSFKLVNNSIASPPINISTLRSAIENDEPIIDCSNVVSVVKRDISSPLRFSSK